MTGPALRLISPPLCFLQVDDLFMWLVQPSLEFIRHHCKVLVQTSPIHLTHTMMTLFDSLLGKASLWAQRHRETGGSYIYFF